MSADRKTGVASAKPSSTIVLLRQGEALPEVLLVKRRAGDAFGECYAFPGGVVDADELHACTFTHGKAPDQANAELQVPDGGLCYYSAGIRELFEETGVLLARDADGNWACEKPGYASLRRKVDKGLLPWSEFLLQEGLRMSCDALHYFAHWETPFELPKRWSTRFFAAELPNGQVACHDGYETTDSRWVTAGEALQQKKAGQIKMPYPTNRTLEVLQQFDTVAALFAWANTECGKGVGRNELDTPDGPTQQCRPN